MSEDTERRLAELRRRWESFIEGTASATETAEWAGDQLGDYGDEEIMHQGLQRLNDHSWRGLEATHATWVSYQDWLEVVHQYVDDPEAWNFNYFRGYLVKLIDGRPEAQAMRFARDFFRHLDGPTIQRLVQIYSRHE